MARSPGFDAGDDLIGDGIGNFGVSPAEAPIDAALPANHGIPIRVCFELLLGQIAIAISDMNLQCMLGGDNQAALAIERLQAAGRKASPTADRIERACTSSRGSTPSSNRARATAAATAHSAAARAIARSPTVVSEKPDRSPGFAMLSRVNGPRGPGVRSP